MLTSSQFSLGAYAHNILLKGESTMKNYNCFSIHQMQFLLSNGQVPIHCMAHSKTKKTFWIFEQNEELSKLLNKWTVNKSNL